MSAVIGLGAHLRTARTTVRQLRADLAEQTTAAANATSNLQAAVTEAYNLGYQAASTGLVAQSVEDVVVDLAQRRMLRILNSQQQQAGWAS